MRTPWWRTRPARAAMVFAATFVALVTAGGIAMRGAGPLAFARQEVPAVPLGDPAWNVVMSAHGTHLDHRVLWHEIGTSIEHARRADVLFVGNSQLQFALPPGELRRFERRTSLSAFSLALPFGEGYRFPLALIEKFDLRPRIVVANVHGFFIERTTAEARQVLGESAWAARTTVWETHLSALAWPPLSRILPSFSTKRTPFTLLRSPEDGTWKPVRWTSGRFPVSTKPMRVDWNLGAARRFDAALRGRGIQLVLTCVPSFAQTCSPVAVRPLATGLAAPVLAPRVHGPLRTRDLAHLSTLSGKRFGRALLRELSALPVVRAITRERSLRPTAR